MSPVCSPRRCRHIHSLNPSPNRTTLQTPHLKADTQIQQNTECTLASKDWYAPRRSIITGFSVMNPASRTADQVRSRPNPDAGIRTENAADAVPLTEFPRLRAPLNRDKVAGVMSEDSARIPEHTHDRDPCIPTRSGTARGIQRHSETLPKSWCSLNERSSLPCAADVQKVDGNTTVLTQSIFDTFALPRKVFSGAR